MYKCIIPLAEASWDSGTQGKARLTLKSCLAYTCTPSKRITSDSRLRYFPETSTSCTKKVLFSPPHLPAPCKPFSQDTPTQPWDGGFEGCWCEEESPHLHLVLFRPQTPLTRCCSLAAREGPLAWFTGERGESSLSTLALVW